MTTPPQYHETQEQPPSKFRVTGEISLGSILQALVVMALGGVLYVVNASNKTDNTAQSVSEMKQTVTSSMVQMKQDLIDKFGAYQTDNNRRFDELSRQVSGLPDQTTTVRLLTDRTSRLESAATERDKIVGQMHDTMLQDHGMMVQDHTDITNIMAANKQKLGK